MMLEKGKQSQKQFHIGTYLFNATSNSNGVIIGLRKSLEDNKLFSGQATKTNTSISGKLANLGTLGLPTRKV